MEGKVSSTAGDGRILIQALQKAEWVGKSFFWHPVLQYLILTKEAVRGSTSGRDHMRDERLRKLLVTKAATLLDSEQEAQEAAAHLLQRPHELRGMSRPLQWKHAKP